MFKDKNEAIKTICNTIAGIDIENTSICVFCKVDVNPETDFNDEISLREWNISHICQKCQDEVFGQ